MTVLDIWLGGVGALALVFALVWLFARRPVPYRVSIWLALALLAWPLALLLGLIAAVLIGAEMWREAIHDDYWKLP